MFLDEWSNYLDRLTTIPQVIITGDLNFHFDDLTDINVRRLTWQLDVYGLVQHVTGATHIHFAIQFTLDSAKPRHSKKEITFHRHCAIPVPDLIQDIKSSSTLLCRSGVVDDLVEAYNSGVKFLINKYAPLQRKTITLRPNAPWYTEELRVGKHNRRLNMSWSSKASHEIQEDLLFRQK